MVVRYLRCNECVKVFSRVFLFVEACGGSGYLGAFFLLIFNCELVSEIPILLFIFC